MAKTTKTDVCDACQAEFSAKSWRYVDGNSKQTCPQCSGLGFRCPRCETEFSLTHVPGKCPACHARTPLEKL